MTTGRINQVTIVRRGWPAGTAKGAGEIVQVTGRHSRGVRRSTASAAFEAAGAALGNPLSPSSFPRAVRPPHRTRWRVVRLGRPKRRTWRAASTMAASATRGYPLLLSKRLANGQPSTEPNQCRREARASLQRCASPASPTARGGQLATGGRSSL